MPTIPAEATRNADAVIAAFDAKAAEVATANGWTLDKARDVILCFFRNTDPDAAAIIAASLLAGSR